MAMRDWVGRKRKGRSFTTFHKLCCVFFFVLIPIFLSSFLLYQQGIRIIRKEIIQSIESKNASYSRTLQNEFLRIIALQDALSSNWDVNKLSLFSGSYSAYERAVAIKNIEDKLWAVQSSSQFIESISIYMAENDISIGTIYTLGVTAGLREMYEDLDQYRKNETIYHDNKLMVLTTRGFSPDGGKPAYFVRTILSTGAMGGFLREQSAHVESGSILYSPLWGELAFSGDPGKKAPVYAAMRSVLADSSGPSGTLSLTAEGKYFTVIYTDLLAGKLFLVQFIEDDQIFASMRPFQWILWGLVVVLVVVFVVFAWYAYKAIHMPLNRLVSAFQTVERGDMDIRINPVGSAEFGYIYTAFDTMIEQLRNTIDQVYKQKLLLQNAELKQLQSQIDPHFLFNSFFILNKRIREQDMDGALQFSESLGVYFQNITRSGRDRVPLAEEWDHAVIYCGIQQVRFANRMEIEIGELPASCLTLSVPRLILQPICENTIKYAIENNNGKGILRLSCEVTDHSIDIVVEDNGRALKDEDIAALNRQLEEPSSLEVSAIVNIHRRLRLFFGLPSGLLLFRGELGGLQVRLRIALKGVETKCISS